MQATISGAEGLTDIYAQTKTWDKEEERDRMGDSWTEADRLVRISCEGERARDEKLYVYNDTTRDSGISVGSDVYHCNVYNHDSARVISGESETLRPVFFILTEKELTLDSVTDLNRIKF
jgi:hypothetical protein